MRGYYVSISLREQKKQLVRSLSFLFLSEHAFVRMNERHADWHGEEPMSKNGIQSLLQKQYVGRKFEFRKTLKEPLCGIITFNRNWIFSFEADTEEKFEYPTMILTTFFGNNEDGETMERIIRFSIWNKEQHHMEKSKIGSRF